MMTAADLMYVQSLSGLRLSGKMHSAAHHIIAFFVANVTLFLSRFAFLTVF